MSDDRRLRELFEAARRGDEVSAPAYANVRGRVAPGNAATVRRPAALPALAVLLAVMAVGLALLWMRSDDRPKPSSPAVVRETQVLSLEDWKSPTDFLLETPGSELFDSTPRLPEPMPHLPARQTRTDRKGARS